MSRIRLLDDHLISQIAAGEVVERPASVVKELIENALDAGAERIEIELEAGGKRRIRVADDGCGMERDDSLLAFDRHATSKIASFDDLQKVGTLGFRGEALAAIAAVSRTTLTTAPAAGEGHRVRIEGERIRKAEPLSRARGTTVEVAGLFFNVPARRKFLKQTATEMRRCVEVVQGYALARPDVHFRLRHGERTLLDAGVTVGAGAARARIGEIFGHGFAEALHDIPRASLGQGASLYGLVGGPETTRGRRIFVFVNQRLVRDRAVLAVFYRAVREQWKSDDFPALFLFLEIEPEGVDVNVHPQKAEVRFRDGALLGRIKGRLEQALAAARGEEEAPLRPLQERPWSGSLAWQGAGARPRHEWPQPGFDELREGGGTPASGKLAEISYALPEQARVRLSGRGAPTDALRVLGQYKGTLILLEGPDGLYLIDQHVAHERVLYERFRRSLESDRPESQQLLRPLLLELAPDESLRLAALADQLEACGFSLVELSGGSLAVSAAPAWLPQDEVEPLLRELAGGAHEIDEDDRETRRRFLDALAASLSCRAAVKMHQVLSLREIQQLVGELFEAEQPYACPHGRPIVLKMSDADLERRFGRS